MVKTKSTKLRSRYKKGGGENSVNMVNILLIGVILFLIYQMNKTRSNQPRPNQHTRVVRKVVHVQDDSDDEPYRENVYRPKGLPFNIPTRGPPNDYDMVGFLQDSTDSSKLKQLYGRRTYPNSNNWNYFVKSDQYHQIPIPVSVGGQNCTDERGCKEIDDKSNLDLLGKEHTANVYKPEPYYYNPYP